MRYKNILLVLITVIVLIAVDLAIPDSGDIMMNSVKVKAIGFIIIIGAVYILSCLKHAFNIAKRRDKNHSDKPKKK